MKAAPVKVPKRLEKVRLLNQIQGYNCAIAASVNEYADTHDLHHAGVPNTKVNRALFPRLIHSIWNLKLVNHWLHMQNGSFGRMSMKEARSRENFLQAHPCIAKKLNLED
jgi:hypothetical protein